MALNALRDEQAALEREGASSASRYAGRLQAAEAREAELQRANHELSHALGEQARDLQARNAVTASAEARIVQLDAWLCQAQCEKAEAGAELEALRERVKAAEAESAAAVDAVSAAEKRAAVATTATSGKTCSVEETLTEGRAKAVAEVAVVSTGAPAPHLASLTGAPRSQEYSTNAQGTDEDGFWTEAAGAEGPFVDVFSSDVAEPLLQQATEQRAKRGSHHERALAARLRSQSVQLEQIRSERGALRLRLEAETSRRHQLERALDQHTTFVHHTINVPMPQAPLPF